MTPFPEGFQIMQQNYAAFWKQKIRSLNALLLIGNVRSSGSRWRRWFRLAVASQQYDFGEMCCIARLYQGALWHGKETRFAFGFVLGTTAYCNDRIRVVILFLAQYVDVMFDRIGLVESRTVVGFYSSIHGSVFNWNAVVTHVLF